MVTLAEIDAALEKNKLPKPIATKWEKAKISEAIASLNAARKTDCERVMMKHLQDAFNDVRAVHRYRNEV